MNQEFVDRLNAYFKEDADKYLELLQKPCTQGFFLNTKKGSAEDILRLIDFEYSKSDLTDSSFYHQSDNIGKTKAYDLGLIYPQEIAASLSSTFIDNENIKTVVDMCAAPGGKSINVLNKLNDDVLCICNDFNHTRAQILSSNIERLGLDNTIIVNKDCDKLANQLENFADLVILDAPCSGEGMIRKYPEILDDYSINNVQNLAHIQSNLLEDAYKMLKGNGQLLYSTCTFALEEDENQVLQFLDRHNDMHLVILPNSFSSSLEGTVKLSPLNNTEGQFICLMRKDSNDSLKNRLKHLIPIKEKLVDDFIHKNLDLDNYYLYKYNNHYYMSLIPLFDLKNNILRYGIYVGDIVNKRFEPVHNLYRSNSLRIHFNFVYDLNDEEYDKFVSGNELRANLGNNYYLITYKGFSLGFVKCSNNQLKNKYPKGLRKML